jgi:CBS domain containing-hemolysin-like protein
VLDASGSALLRMLGFHSTLEHTSVFTEEEIRQIVSVSHERGHLKPDEQILINNVFNFADTVVREIMVPRPEIVAVDVSASLDQVVAEFERSGYSRMPVYRGVLDEVVGIVHGKDLMPYLAASSSGFRLESALHPPLFVHSAAPLEDVLRQMQKGKAHCAMVVDEHGSVEGIVTLEDLLEEIVGEIHDEHDADEAAAIRRDADGSYLLAGGLSVREINRKLATALPESDDYTTLAGLLMSRSGRLLVQGDRVEIDGIAFAVEATDQRRVTRVRMSKITPAASS